MYRGSRTLAATRTGLRARAMPFTLLTSRPLSLRSTVSVVRTAPVDARKTTVFQTLITPSRAYSGAPQTRVIDQPAQEVDYAEVKKLASNPDPNVVIVDVREPDEYAAGHIPHAINIPFKSMPGALGLDSPDFEDALGFDKPDPKKTLLFYCLGGVRSTASEQLASTFGYGKRLNYVGSYTDWVQNEQK